MVLYLYIVIFLFFLLIILCFVPVIIELIFMHNNKKNNEDDEDLVINIYLGLKFINLRLRIPLIENRMLDFIFKMKGEIESDIFNLFPGKGEIEFEEALVDEEFINKLDEIYNIIKKRDYFFEVLSNLKMKCKKLTWKTKLGLSDPAITGMIIGFFWAIKGSIISYFDQKIFPIKDKTLDITPLFTGKEFSFTLKGIFTIYLGNIILTGVKLLLYRIKGGFSEWPNTQLKN